MTRYLIPLLLLTALPLTASAEVLWRGDYETGDISQWTKAQQVSPDRLEVQTGLVKEGRYALKATVRRGDDPINSSGNRNELVDVHYQPEGAERYYRWYTYFDPSYPSETMWQVFTQWHQREDSGSPPIEFDVYGEEIHLTNSRNVIWRTDLVRGVWHEFIFHVKWSKNSDVGFVELWYDGQLVLPKRYLRTDSDVYLKQGLYRNENISGTGVVFHDGMIMTTSLDDVRPQQPPPVAGGGTPATPPDGTSTTVALSEDSSSGSNALASEQAGCSTAAGGLAIPALALLLGALRRRRR